MVLRIGLFKIHLQFLAILNDPQIVSSYKANVIIGSSYTLLTPIVLFGNLISLQPLPASLETSGNFFQGLTSFFMEIPNFPPEQFAWVPEYCFILKFETSPLGIIFRQKRAVLVKDRVSQIVLHLKAWTCTTI